MPKNVFRIFKLEILENSNLVANFAKFLRAIMCRATYNVE